MEYLCRRCGPTMKCRSLPMSVNVTYMVLILLTCGLALPMQIFHNVIALRGVCGRCGGNIFCAPAGR